MIQKRVLSNFISKYYLNGLIEKVQWNSDNDIKMGKELFEGKDVYICANEKGFGSQIRTDMIFSVTELIKKKES